MIPGTLSGERLHAARLAPARPAHSSRRHETTPHHTTQFGRIYPLPTAPPRLDPTDTNAILAPYLIRLFSFHFFYCHAFNRPPPPPPPPMVAPSRSRAREAKGRKQTRAHEQNMPTNTTDRRPQDARQNKTRHDMTRQAHVLTRPTAAGSRRKRRPAKRAHLTRRQGRLRHRQAAHMVVAPTGAPSKRGG